MTVSLLEASQVSKRYADIFALDDISLSLEASRITGLIGPNGSGKTTLFEIIAGLIPANGTLRVSGREVLPHERCQHLFYLPDNLLPYGETSVSRVCDFFCGVFSAADNTRQSITELLGLRPVLAKRVGELSKGFRKRLCLAISLWAPQPILLLDEPFDGFDLRQTLSITEVLRDTAKAGKTLLLSIHQLLDAERICERFVLLNQGKLVATGNLDELRKQTTLTGGGLAEVFLALT